MSTLNKSSDVYEKQLKLFNIAKNDVNVSTSKKSTIDFLGEYRVELECHEDYYIVKSYIIRNMTCWLRVQKHIMKSQYAHGYFYKAREPLSRVFRLTLLSDEQLLFAVETYDPNKGRKEDELDIYRLKANADIEFIARYNSKIIQYFPKLSILAVYSVNKSPCQKHCDLVEFYEVFSGKLLTQKCMLFPMALNNAIVAYTPNCLEEKDVSLEMHTLCCVNVNVDNNDNSNDFNVDISNPTSLQPRLKSDLKLKLDSKQIDLKISPMSLKIGLGDYIACYSQDSSLEIYDPYQGKLVKKRKFDQNNCEFLPVASKRNRVFMHVFHSVLYEPPNQARYILDPETLLVTETQEMDCNNSAIIFSPARENIEIMSKAISNYTLLTGVLSNIIVEYLCSK